jgi:uracil-DNA glycosylase
VFLPTYHPAAGMRFPAIAAALREDFCRLRTQAETGR